MAQRYSTAFKDRMVGRLIGPSKISATALSKEVGVGQELLSRWLREAHKIDGMSPPRKRWTGAEKLRVLAAARGLSETELGAFLRHEGVHESDLTAWQTMAEAALSDTSPRTPAAEGALRVAALERELLRKDKALAETAALLVLKKKAQAIWGDEGDDTIPRRER